MHFFVTGLRALMNIKVCLSPRSRQKIVLSASNPIFAINKDHWVSFFRDYSKRAVTVAPDWYITMLEDFPVPEIDSTATGCNRMPYCQDIHGSSFSSRVIPRLIRKRGVVSTWDERLGSYPNIFVVLLLQSVKSLIIIRQECFQFFIS